MVDSLAMVEYGLGLLPLIREMCMACPSVTQPWYADDAGAGVTFKGIRRHLDNLMVQGAPRSYFLEPNKIV